MTKDFVAELYFNEFGWPVKFMFNKKVVELELKSYVVYIRHPLLPVCAFGRVMNTTSLSTSKSTMVYLTVELP